MGKASISLATVSARIGLHVGVFLLILGLLTATAFVLPLPISAEWVVVWAVPVFGLYLACFLIYKGIYKAHRKSTVRKRKIR
jgi:membrane protein implicated in regulation of membrane protease activity